MTTVSTRNPRRIVLVHLARVARTIRPLQGKGRWGQEQRVFDPESNPKWRARRPEEKIELNLRAWFELRVEVRAAADELRAIDQVCQAEIERLRSREEIMREANVA